jgi:hypothetical protein
MISVSTLLDQARDAGRSPEEPKHDTGRPLLAFRAMRTNSGASYHALPVGGHPWIRAICGAAPGSRSAGWTVAGGEVTCPHCRQRLDDVHSTARASEPEGSLRPQPEDHR